MSIEILPLCTCPYCEGEKGEVLLNVRSFVSACERREERPIDLDEQSELDFLIFNSDRPQPGPCNHLVFFTGDVEVGGYEEGDSFLSECGLEFDWWAPISHQLDSVSESFMFEVFDGDTPLQFHRGLPFWIKWFSECWPEQKPAAEPTCYYDVQGNGFFCRDVEAFFKELVAQPDKYWDWWSGTNDLGAGLFLEGFRATLFGGIAGEHAIQECEAIVQAKARSGCADEYYDEEDCDEED